MFKKLFTISVITLSLYACSNAGTGEEKKEEKKEEKTEEASLPNTNPDYEKGLALIAKSDCLTCHKVDEKLTGPAYRDVANKYPNTPETINQLAGKIIKGGAGVWGTVPMTPHTSLPEDDAKQMVKYILLLKTN